MKKREVKYRTKLFLNSLKVSLQEIIFRVKCNTESILPKKLVIEKERYDLNKRYSRKI